MHATGFIVQLNMPAQRMVAQVHGLMVLILKKSLSKVGKYDDTERLNTGKRKLNPTPILVRIQ